MKTHSNRAWFFVLPVIALVAFNALVPLMTVVNYSVQETFGNNQFFWHGVGWFEDLLRSERFHAALGRHFVIETEVAGHRINAIAKSRDGIDGDRTYLRFDPAQTRLYADGWVVNSEPRP